MKNVLRAMITLMLATCLPIAAVAASYTLGDVNMDGSINMRDVLTVYRITKGDLIAEEDAMTLADVTGDGIVNMRDVLRIYQTVRGEGTSGTDPIPGDNVGDDW